MSSFPQDYIYVEQRANQAQKKKKKKKKNTANSNAENLHSHWV
jgi:hypothetical protein